LHAAKFEDFIQEFHLFFHRVFSMLVSQSIMTVIHEVELEKNKQKQQY